MKVFIKSEGFPVEFILNNKPVSFDIVDSAGSDHLETMPAPDTTILKMLRKRGLVGTKEAVSYTHLTLPTKRIV